MFTHKLQQKQSLTPTINSTADTDIL